MRPRSRYHGTSAGLNCRALRKCCESPPLKQVLACRISPLHVMEHVFASSEKQGREPRFFAEGLLDHAVELHRHDGGDPLGANGFHRAPACRARDNRGQTVGTPNEIRALSAIQSMPYVLVTRAEHIKTIRILRHKTASRSPP